MGISMSFGQITVVFQNFLNVKSQQPLATDYVRLVTEIKKICYET